MTFPQYRARWEGRVGAGVHPAVTHEVAYAREIRREFVEPFIRELRARIRRASTDYASVTRAIDRNIARDSPDLEPVVRAAIRRIDRYHQRRFAQAMRRSLGVRVNPLAGDAEVARLMREKIRANVALIRSIPRHFQDALLSDIGKIQREQPFDEAEIMRLFRRRYQKEGYPLRRLARDQTSKMVGNLSEIRQTAAGVLEYQWESSRDERVRPTHVANNGRRFSWAVPPPETGHPGEDIQCRCVALPVL